MEGERRLATLVSTMNLLLVVFLVMRAVGCDQKRCTREKRERGRNPRHITEYVREVEGIDGDGGDLGASHAYPGASDEEEAKEQVVLTRIREAFLFYRDRQSLEAKRREEDEARRATLRKLGYHEPPPENDLEENRSPPVSALKGAMERPAPQRRRDEAHLMSLIERHEGQKRRERAKRSQSIDSVNVDKIIQFAQSATKAGFGQLPNGYACFFERPAGADPYLVTSAAFYVYIHGCKRRRVQHNSVLVYLVSPSAVYRRKDSQVVDDDEDRELLATKSLLSGSHSSAWHRFDVTTMVQNWMMGVGLMADADWIVLTLEFSVFDQEVVYPLDTGDQEHLPYLEMNVEPRPISRRRRRRSIFSSDVMEEMEETDHAADDDDDDDDSPATTTTKWEEECSELASTTITAHCCRRSMEVDFQSVGLRWVISPRSFRVSYCDGQCSRSPTGTRQRLMTPGLTAAIADRKTGGLCCAPVEYADLDIVYYDDNLQVIFGTLRNFNVIRCGCL